MAVEEAHLVEGFGRISTVEGNAVGIDWTGAEAVRAAQGGIVSHMNEDHGDAIDLYARDLMDLEGQGWRLLEVDPLGCNLVRESQVRRMEFPHRVTSVVAVREVFVALAQQARSVRNV